MPSFFSRLLPLLLSLALLGCAQLSEQAGPVQAAPAVLEGWSGRELPGKRATRYSLTQREGQACLLAQAERSASLWRRRLQLDPQQLGGLEFDWWIASQHGGATVADPETDDASARLLLAFDGDMARLSARNRMLFELAHTLTGEAPPYATLMYVWDAKAAPETVVVSQRSDRVRKIIVGTGAAGKPRWQRFKRDVAADFKRAFGEAPGLLIGAAFMTDGDNTRSHAEACYGALVFRDAQQRSLPGSLLF
jgi:Protein of unknown function (DUF3047)